jgi:hypothetical protein
MNADSGTGAGAGKLPEFSLDVQALDLGPNTNALGIELIDTQSREPVKGKEAVEIWAAVLEALPGAEPFVVDFFSHLDRVRGFCEQRKISFRLGAERCLVLAQPDAQQLHEILDRFSTETFGMRAGAAASDPDLALEGQLSKRGLDAYQEAYARYEFCAVCEPDDGWLTLLSDTLSSTVAIQRLRPAVQPFDIYISLPN